MSRKSLFLVVALYVVLATFFSDYTEARSSVSVKGHFRKYGTYVPPHHRSAPDRSFYNNWSTTENINPYTGKEGSVNYPRKFNGGYGHQSPSFNIPSIPYSPPSYIPSAPLATPSDPTTQPEFHIPQNARLNYWGNGWECERGFRQSGSGCVAVQVPQNAQLNYWGNGWECVEGFQSNGASCIRGGGQ